MLRLGAAVFFGEDQHAGFATGGAEQGPALLRVLFHNLYITSLGPLQFSTREQDTITSTLSCTATFDYDYYAVVEYRRT